MKVIIGEHSCQGCPEIWDCEIIKNGQSFIGYIKYRWGILSLKPVTERAGIFTDAIISEQLGDEFDGVIELDVVIDWLQQNGYEVEMKP